MSLGTVLTWKNALVTDWTPRGHIAVTQSTRTSSSYIVLQLGGGVFNNYSCLSLCYVIDWTTLGHMVSSRASLALVCILIRMCSSSYTVLQLCH